MRRLVESRQYTSIDFGRRCRNVGIDLSMGSVGDCFDNAMAESFFASLETELFYQHKFRGHTDARYEIMRYLDWSRYAGDPSGVRGVRSGCLTWSFLRVLFDPRLAMVGV